MRVLLIGKSGQVGHHLARALTACGEVVAPDRDQLDLSQTDSIRTTVRTIRPDVIVNAAGMTDVDQAEAQRDLAMQINGIAPGVLAEEARKADALLVHYSTAMVFDGEKRSAYTEDDAPDPINAYGHSKLAGEEAVRAAGADHLILRAGWTYSDRRTNFVLAMLEQVRDKAELVVVKDQIGTPTWAKSYAAAVAALLQGCERLADFKGTYHLSGAGQATRFEWAEAIVNELAERSGHGIALRPILSSAYPHAAPRPMYTVLDNSKFLATFGFLLPSWRDELRIFMAGLFAGARAPAGLRA
jgi:dTDP-4-dehydrorhamnose reductase